MTMGKLSLALAEIERVLKTYDKLSFSERTSVHVHLDVSDLEQTHRGTLFALYIIFEESLYNYVGRNREDNNYCTKVARSITGEATLQSFVVGELDGGLIKLFRNGEYYRTLAIQKYAALNLTRLGDLGTFEFRHHWGTCSSSRIQEWCKLILSLKEWVINNSI